MSIEKAAGVLAGVVKMDVAELTEKLGTDEGVKEISDKLATLEILTPADKTAMLNNYRNTVKDSLYSDHKRDILAAKEKDIIKKFGIEGLEAGKDFKNIEELTEKILEIKAKTTKTPDDNKELETLRTALKEANDKLESIPTSIRTEYEQKIAFMSVQNEIHKLSALVDVEEKYLVGQLELIEKRFKETYTVKNIDGQNIVFKGDEKLVDKNFQPVSVEDAVKLIAEAAVPLKSKAPAGHKATPGSKTPADVSAFKSFDEYANSTSSGKDLVMGSPEWQKLYKQYKDAGGK